MKTRAIIVRFVLTPVVTVGCGCSLGAAKLLLPSAIQNAFKISGAAYFGTAMGVDSTGNMYLAGRFIGAVPFTGFPVSNKTKLGTLEGYPGIFAAKISPSAISCCT